MSHLVPACRVRLVLALVFGSLVVGEGEAARGQSPPASDPAPANSIRSVAQPSGTIFPTPTVSLGEDPSVVARLRMALNVAWVMVAGVLVMSLKVGFSLLETGLTRAKNVAHTVSMNLATYAVGMMGFWACGFAFMFGGHGPFPSLGREPILDAMGSITLFGHRWDLIGHDGFFLHFPADAASIFMAFLFQATFVDAAATIPTGAMAERWKFRASLAFGFAASMVIYPVYGCWVWGNGWLADLGVMFGMGSGMVDFAGSSVVHLTGGVMALTGALALGPRIGKYAKNGSVNAIPGHNIPMVVVGTMILAVGWFGFNAGRAVDVADLRIGSIATCTLLATGAGCLASMGTMWATFGKPDPTMSCNGLLAGAVAISASCAFVNPIGAVAIGAIAGSLVVGSILFVEKGLKVDDPVGAISVHGVCGAFGTLCVGLFATGEYGAGYNGVAEAPIGVLHGGGFGQLLAQMIGVATNLAWSGVASVLAFTVIGRTIGNRVSARAEVDGLDVPEMGVLGYVPEETYAVQTASQDYLATFGPGVPPKGSSGPAKGAGRKPGPR